MELFELKNPKTDSITCVGYLSSPKRRCRKVTGKSRINAAESIMKQLLRPGVSDSDMKTLLCKLAGFTLCWMHHGNQAAAISDEWYLTMRAHMRTGHKQSDKVNAASERRRNEHDADSGTFHRARRDTNDPPPNESNRRSPSADERIDREREEAACRAEEARMREERAQREAEREAEIRRIAEQSRREEARRQAQRERAEREAEKRGKAEREAEAERERLRREQAEKEVQAKLEREARQRQNRQSQSWESVWKQYDQAWSEISKHSTQLEDTDVRTHLIWPTKTGLYDFCSEADVKVFYRRWLDGHDQKALRRQAMRWHPDRASRLFAHLRDGGELLKKATMIMQVVNGLMGR